MMLWGDIKKLLEDPNFFLTFGEFTEPSEEGRIKRYAKEIKKPTDVFNIISRFKKEKVSLRFIWTAKFMEKYKVVGGCTEYAILTASLLRTAGFPTALLEALAIKDLYQPINSGEYYLPRSMHTMNLVFWKNSWWLLDSQATAFTKHITMYNLSANYMPLIVHRDYSDISVKTREDKFRVLFSRAKEVLPLILEEDILYPELSEFLHDHGNQP